MGRTPTTPGGLQGTSVRMDSRQMGWVAKEAKQIGNANEVIRLLVSDAMTVLGLPPPVLEALEADAESRGIRFDTLHGRREYLMRVLMLRYDAIVKGSAPKLGEMAGAKKAAKR
jgi:hypothetical protein